MKDEVLEAEARDQLVEQGLDEDSIVETMRAMREAGMFDIPDWP